MITTRGNPGLVSRIPSARFALTRNGLPLEVLGVLLMVGQGCASLQAPRVEHTRASGDKVIVPRQAPVSKAAVPDRAKSEKAKISLVSTGPASWYGPGFIGKKTASGEIFDDTKYTAAHKTLPLGSRVKVTNLENGRSVRVQINDRGPYAGNRIIDLSQAAARALGMVGDGVAPVRIELHDDDS